MTPSSRSRTHLDTGESARDAVAKFASHPALLMWYGLDEPAEGSYGMAETLRDAYHASDEQHPVYSVSCRPDIFAEQAAFTACPAKRYLLLVNGTSDKIECEATIPNAEKVSQPFRDFFKRRGDVLAVASGRFRIALAPYGTRAYATE